jgi:hypothetical protein
MNLFLLGQLLAEDLVIELYEKDDTMTTLGANYARVCNTLYWNNKKQYSSNGIYIHVCVYVYIHIQLQSILVGCPN